MPFDDFGLPQDALTALVAPVPITVLEAHKYAVQKRFGRSFSRWIEVPLSRDLLTKQLARPLKAKAPAAGAPWRVRRLARRVRDALPTAEFSLGYFYKDPYLLVHYQSRTACLAIWDSRFRLAAIATYKKKAG